ncbi:hypothetical protein KAJ61_05395 [Candidatus Parcubacteria bacterium]|nr:hypothetical protein [Candidatus Parcubacteria bacterium]
MEYFLLITQIIILIFVFKLYQKIEKVNLYHDIDINIILDTIVEKNILTNEELKSKQQLAYKNKITGKKQRSKQQEVMNKLLNINNS